MEGAGREEGGKEETVRGGKGRREGERPRRRERGREEGKRGEAGETEEGDEAAEERLTWGGGGRRWTVLTEPYTCERGPGNEAKRTGGGEEGAPN